MSGALLGLSEAVSENLLNDLVYIIRARVTYLRASCESDGQLVSFAQTTASSEHATTRRPPAPHAVMLTIGEQQKVEICDSFKQRKILSPQSLSTRQWTRDRRGRRWLTGSSSYQSPRTQRPVRPCGRLSLRHVARHQLETATTCRSPLC